MATDCSLCLPLDLPQVVHIVKFHDAHIVRRSAWLQEECNTRFTTQPYIFFFVFIRKKHLVL
ncbi:hypothetical protein Sjap_022654 [Stephania japonica]|uniref:Uncharacterized protein n=1 Tax=Stephania japonica TaxID=461633 RepID=A0AAP0EUN9_9MAGN